jgi:hypothetical protein
MALLVEIRTLVFLEQAFTTIERSERFFLVVLESMTRRGPQELAHMAEEEEEALNLVLLWMEGPALMPDAAVIMQADPLPTVCFLEAVGPAGIGLEPHRHRDMAPQVVFACGRSSKVRGFDD